MLYLHIYFFFFFWRIEVVLVVQIDAQDIVLNFQETFQINFYKSNLSNVGSDVGGGGGVVLPHPMHAKLHN